MTPVLHLLRDGETCADDLCPADHVRVPPQRVRALDGTLWTTREGETLRVSDMTPRHALNTYLMLHRRARSYVWREVLDALESSFAPQGEIACDAMESAHDEMLERPHAWLDRQPLIRALWARVLDGLPSAR